MSDFMDKKVEHLDTELRRIINNFCDEWDVSLAAVVGTLEVIKSDCIRKANADMEDEDDE